MNRKTDQIIAVYDRIAPFYDTVLTLTALLNGVDPVQERKTLIRHLRLRSGQRVLEVGAGTGTDMALCASCLDTRSFVAGVDISEAGSHIDFPLWLFSTINTL